MRTILLPLALTGVLAFETVALADGHTPRTISVTAGAGFDQYLGDTMRQLGDDLGSWTVHADLAVHRHLALEVGYRGAAATLTTPLGRRTTTLLGTSFEAVARVLPLPDQPIRPYLLVGAGRQHDDALGGAMTLAATGMNDADARVEIPMGAGVDTRYDGVVFDLRVTVRASLGDRMVPEGDGYATMSTWGVELGIGHEL